MLIIIRFPFRAERPLERKQYVVVEEPDACWYEDDECDEAPNRRGYNRQETKRLLAEGGEGYEEQDTQEDVLSLEDMREDRVNRNDQCRANSNKSKLNSKCDGGSRIRSPKNIRSEREGNALNNNNRAPNAKKSNNCPINSPERNCNQNSYSNRVLCKSDSPEKRTRNRKLSEIRQESVQKESNSREGSPKTPRCVKNEKCNSRTSAERQDTSKDTSVEKSEDVPDCKLNESTNTDDTDTAFLPERRRLQSHHHISKHMAKKKNIKEGKKHNASTSSQLNSVPSISVSEFKNKEQSPDNSVVCNNEESNVDNAENSRSQLLDNHNSSINTNRPFNRKSDLDSNIKNVDNSPIAKSEENCNLMINTEVIQKRQSPIKSVKPKTPKRQNQNSDKYQGNMLESDSSLETKTQLSHDINTSIDVTNLKKSPKKIKYKSSTIIVDDFGSEREKRMRTDTVYGSADAKNGGPKQASQLNYEKAFTSLSADEKKQLLQLIKYFKSGKSLMIKPCKEYLDDELFERAKLQYHYALESKFLGPNSCNVSLASFQTPIRFVNSQETVCDNMDRAGARRNLAPAFDYSHSLPNRRMTRNSTPKLGKECAKLKSLGSIEKLTFDGASVFKNESYETCESRPCTNATKKSSEIASCEDILLCTNSADRVKPRVNGSNYNVSVNKNEETLDDDDYINERSATLQHPKQSKFPNKYTGDANKLILKDRSINIAKQKGDSSAKHMSPVKSEICHLKKFDQHY